MVLFVIKVRQAAAWAWHGSQLCVRISVYVSLMIIVIMSSYFSFLRFKYKSFLIFHTDDGFIFPAEDKDPEDKPKKRRKRMKELPREDSTDDGKVTAKKMKEMQKKKSFKKQGKTLRGKPLERMLEYKTKCTFTARYFYIDTY